MRDNRVVLTPYELLDVLECHINKTVNDHFTAVITGHVADDKADDYLLSCNESTGITIMALDSDGGMKTVFKGGVTEAWLGTEGGLKTLTIRAITRTTVLDQKQETRTFQYEQQTYQEVCDFIRALYDGSVFLYTTGISETTETILVQYEETDWEFMKRIASRLNSVLVPDIENDNLCFCFGMPKKADKFMEETPSYRVEKEVGEYLYKKENTVPLSEQDAVNYVFQCREIWEVCSPVTFLGQQMYVYRILSDYDGQELIHTYYLRSKAGFKTKTQRNLKLMGVSLDGRIIDVKNDVVKVHADVDPKQPIDKAKWFPYSTVYSSPDGTGWYVMPEINDAVRIYCPNEDEKNAYVISSVHLDNPNQRRVNPDFKSMRTKWGKEVEFTPSTIRVSNNNGMEILMDDNAGISLTSDKDIIIKSTKSVHINGIAKVDIEGNHGVDLRQQDNKVTITEDLQEFAKGIFHK